MYSIPLSPYAKIFHNEWKLDHLRCDYNIVFDQEFDGCLDIDKLNHSVKSLVTNYVILNSHVEEINGKLYWKKNATINFVQDLGNEVSNQVVFDFIQQPFALDNEPLYRFGLIQSGHKCRLIVVLHHITLDGTSFDYFVKELSNFYNNKNYMPHVPYKAQASNLLELTSKLSNQYNANKNASMEFWKAQLADVEEINLSFLANSVNTKHWQKTISEELSIPHSSGVGQFRFSFDKNTLHKLSQLKRKIAITEFLFSHSVFACLIYKYSGQKKFCISYPVAIKEGMDFIYGAQVNTNLIVYDFDKIINIYDIISQTKSFFKLLKERDINHHFLPIIDIISAANKNILNVAFNQTKLKDQVFDFGIENTAINYDTNINLTNDLLFAQEIRDGELNFRVKYKSAKINRDSLNEFTESYKKLFMEILDELLEKQDFVFFNKIEDYTILSSKRYNQIVYEWNKTEAEYPEDRTIQNVFEEQVLNTPDNIAVVYEDTKLTYKELNERSNQLAHYLINNFDIKPDTLIALCLDRSEHMLIAILATLKAGGAYVPIDPSYPEDRIKYILQDTDSKVLLTNEIYKTKLDNAKDSSSQHKVIAIDSLGLSKELQTKSVVNPITETTSINLAYVIYTSGTTGNPKGVMIEHKGVVNRIKWMNDTYPLNSSDKILQKTPYVFDVSVWELLWAHWYGAAIVFAKPEGHKDSQYLIDLISKESISIIHFVPSMLSVFVDSLKIRDNSFLVNLRKIFCSGEALNLCQVQECQRLLVNSEIHNLYGPTETSIDVLYYNCTDKNIDKVLIGKPISNTTVYVLDAAMRPLPVGAIGELYIGGVGLARGYLNRPDLTSEKFVANPLQTEKEKKLSKNTRLYKTGDLVRWNFDGYLEYIGRNDFQVKIRGYRIELGEIESALLSYDGIKRSVVLAKEQIDSSGNPTGNKYLVAYYVADNKLKESEIFAYLQDKLPEYMIPGLLQHMTRLPLTTNGKLDKKALPNPEFGSNEHDNYLAPRNKIENKLCNIWSEVLFIPADKISINDDFFRLGGDSIISIQLVSSMRQRLDLNISVKDIFSHKTIKRLYDNVLSKETPKDAKVL